MPFEYDHICRDRTAKYLVDDNVDLNGFRLRSPLTNSIKDPAPMLDESSETISVVTMTATEARSLVDAWCKSSLRPRPAVQIDFQKLERCLDAATTGVHWVDVRAETVRWISERIPPAIAKPIIDRINSRSPAAV